jgi:hypothetical protein
VLPNRGLQILPKGSTVIRRLFFAVVLLVSSAGYAAPAPDTQGNRLAAANRLFELPAYRAIATRQLYEWVNSLPAGQNKRALAALSDPSVKASLRGVISRSMAQTFTTAELEHLARFLKAEEARTMIDKAQSFQEILSREFLSSSVHDPELIKILIGK